MKAREIFMSALPREEKISRLRRITDPSDRVQAEGYIRSLARARAARISSRAERFVSKPGELKRVMPDGSRVPMGEKTGSQDGPPVTR